MNGSGGGGTEGRPDWRPFGEGEPPRSAGGLTLPEALAEFCECHWGISRDETGRALAGKGEPDRVAEVRSSARFLGGLILDGEVRSWIRPIGGGEREPFGPDRWELDDFTRRFGTGTVDPAKWADPVAPGSHWIFVDEADFERFMERWCQPVVPTAGGGEESGAPDQLAQRSRAVLRLPEVRARTGLGRSTIYERMAEGRFPQSVALGGRMIGWYEDEVERWCLAPADWGKGPD